MATYEQMIEKLADWREVDKRWNDSDNISYGYSKAIEDMFGKSRDEVLDNMKAVLVARGW